MKKTLMLLLAALSLCVYAQLPVNIPMTSQINLGSGDAITNFTSFISDDMEACTHTLLDSGWYGNIDGKPAVDLVKAGYAPVDVSDPSTVIEFTARYNRYNGNFTDCPIFVRLLDINGKQWEVGMIYQTGNGDPAYPIWTTKTYTLATGGAPDVDFDKTQVTAVQFYGTNWNGGSEPGNSFIDIKDLKLEVKPAVVRIRALNLDTLSEITGVQISGNDGADFTETTTAVRNYNAPTKVTLSAPSQAGALYFKGWDIDGVQHLGKNVWFKAEKSGVTVEVTAYYSSNPATVQVDAVEYETSAPISGVVVDGTDEGGSWQVTTSGVKGLAFSATARLKAPDTIVNGSTTMFFTGWYIDGAAIAGNPIVVRGNPLLPINAVASYSSSKMRISIHDSQGFENYQTGSLNGQNGWSGIGTGGGIAPEVTLSQTPAIENKAVRLYVGDTQGDASEMTMALDDIMALNPHAVIVTYDIYREVRKQNLWWWWFDAGEPTYGLDWDIGNMAPFGWNPGAQTGTKVIGRWATLSQEWLFDAMTALSWWDGYMVDSMATINNISTLTGWTINLAHDSDTGKGADTTYIDNFAIDALVPPASVVTGKILLNDLAVSQAGYYATLKFYKSDNTNCDAPDAVKTVTTDADGNFSVIVPPLGANCRVVVKAGKETAFDTTARFHWLAKRVNNVNIGSGSVDIGTVTLSNGDINDDNMVDAFDFTILMQAYDIAEDMSLGQSDINNDGYVDAFDFTLLMLTYDTAGDTCN